MCTQSTATHSELSNKKQEVFVTHFNYNRDSLISALTRKCWELTVTKYYTPGEASRGCPSPFYISRFHFSLVLVWSKPLPQNKSPNTLETPGGVSADQVAGLVGRVWQHEAVLPRVNLKCKLPFPWDKIVTWFKCKSQVCSFSAK